MSLAAKQARNAVPRKLQDALDALDNFEALHRFGPAEAHLWARARGQLLGVMGAMIALDQNNPEPVSVSPGEGE